MNKPSADLKTKPLPEPNWLKPLSFFSTALNRIAAGAAAILLVMMVGLILIEIVLRFFSRSTFMTDVLVGYGVAAITFLALGHTLEQGSMIRISALTQRLSRIPRLLAAGFSIVTVELLAVWLMFFEWRSISKLWIRGTSSQHSLPIPLWIPEAIFFIGLGLLALQLLVLFLRLVAHGNAENAILKL